MKIEADLTDLNKIIQGMDIVRNYFNMPQAMTPAVRAMGAGWLDNFRSEGARVGGWKPLKEYTIREREARGYKAGPKLHQSGNLERGAVRPFVNWPEAQMRFNTTVAPTPARARTRSGGFSNDQLDMMASGPTRITASVNPRSVFANVSGAKAVNQTGGNLRVGSSSGWTNVPARPFWFFDVPMVNKAAEGIVGRFSFYAFRYMPKVTGISQSGWSQSMGTPSRPSVNPGPAADPWFERR